MALYAFDGTWNSRKTEDNEEKNTNVVRFVDMYTGDRKHHVAGVGTRLGWFGKIFGGAFGAGGRKRLKEAYSELCQNYVNGDKEIDIVGFSRGAALALDFSNRIRKKGIRHPATKKKLVKSPEIRFLGLWDVVASFGIPFNLGIPFHRINLGHHLKLPKNVKFCFHALALDERRQTFRPTRVKRGYEVWFRGVHSDIGGGNRNFGLNNIALRWMLKKARAAGLPLDEGAIEALDAAVDLGAPLREPKDPIKNRRRKVTVKDTFHYTVDHRTDKRYTNRVPGADEETLADEEGNLDKIHAPVAA